MSRSNAAKPARFTVAFDPPSSSGEAEPRGTIQYRGQLFRVGDEVVGSILSTPRSAPAAPSEQVRGPSREAVIKDMVARLRIVSGYLASCSHRAWVE